MADFDPKETQPQELKPAPGPNPDPWPSSRDPVRTPSYGDPGGAAGDPATHGGIAAIPAKDPYTDGTPADGRPQMLPGMLFMDQGSLGLRQYGGWVREEFLRALQGREAARVYREMRDNDATIGAMLFAIEQTIREIEWTVEPAGDDAESRKWADFVTSLKDDMRHSWMEFIVEALSMLPFGYAPMEIVWKRRDGEKDPYWGGASTPAPESSKYDDGLIGVADIPLRGQETVLRWFFDDNGQITGMQQQPWIGTLINIPSFKLALFRPRHYKNNPEGVSILRNAYRGYFFIKRIEEEEAILFERMNGLPVLHVPSFLLEQEKKGDVNATSAMAAYRKLVTNTRIDEQMGIILPSDMWAGENGPTGHPMYKFELMVPTGSHMVDPEKVLTRYQLNMLKTVMADFIDLGHQARGTQNLAISKVDMFFNAIRGWLAGMADEMDRSFIRRTLYLNGVSQKYAPHMVPDLAQRIDLDAISNFVLRLSQAGARMFPDDNLENYLREAAGMPDLELQDYDVDTPTGYSNTPTGIPMPQHREDFGQQGDSTQGTNAQSVAKWLSDELLKRRIRELKGRKKWDMRPRTPKVDPPPHTSSGLSTMAVTG